MTRLAVNAQAAPEQSTARVHLTQQDVSVTIVFQATEALEALFGDELLDIDADHATAVFEQQWPTQHVDALWLRIENHSKRIYAFKKSNVSARYLPATQLAAQLRWREAASRETMVWSARTFPRAVFAMPGAIAGSFTRLLDKTRPAGTATARLLSPIIRGPSWLTFPRPRTQQFNEALAMRLQRAEIADASIRRSGLLVGFLFLPRAERAHPVHVTLLDVETHEPLVFDLPRSEAP